MTSSIGSAASDRLRRCAIVPGEHHEPESIGLERLERGRRRLLHRITDRDSAGQMAIDSQKNDGAALPPELVNFALECDRRRRHLPASAQHCPRRVNGRRLCLAPPAR